MRITEEREQAVLERLKADLKEARPSPVQLETWKAHRPWYGDKPWGFKRDTIAKVNNYWRKVFGSQSRAYRYGSFIRRTDWCGNGVALAAEKAYLAGAEDAIALLKADGRKLRA